MLKKLTVILAVVIVAISVVTINKQPLFIEFSDTYELYLYSSSSNAVTVYTDAYGYKNYKKIKGESFKTDKSDFDVEKFFLDMNAKLIFTESIFEGVSYYGYSDDIKYGEMINGQKINLHVFVGKNQVKVGAPIIYGSF